MRIKYTSVCEAPTTGQGTFSLNGEKKLQQCASLWAKRVARNHVFTSI